MITSRRSVLQKANRRRSGRPTASPDSLSRSLQRVQEKKHRTLETSRQRRSTICCSSLFNRGYIYGGYIRCTMPSSQPFVRAPGVFKAAKGLGEATAAPLLRKGKGKEVEAPKSGGSRGSEEPPHHRLCTRAGIVAALPSLISTFLYKSKSHYKERWCIQNLTTIPSTLGCSDAQLISLADTPLNW